MVSKTWAFYFLSWWLMFMFTILKLCWIFMNSFETQRLLCIIFCSVMLSPLLSQRTLTMFVGVVTPCYTTHKHRCRYSERSWPKFIHPPINKPKPLYILYLVYNGCFLLILLGKSKTDSFRCNKLYCGDRTFGFPIGTNVVNFTATDQSGNTGSCVFQVTVRGELIDIII